MNQQDGDDETNNPPKQSSSRRELVKYKEGSGRTTTKREGIAAQYVIGKRSNQPIKVGTLKKSDDPLENLPSNFFDANAPNDVRRVSANASALGNISNLTNITVNDDSETSVTDATSTGGSTGSSEDDTSGSETRSKRMSSSDVESNRTNRRSEDMRLVTSDSDSQPAKEIRLFDSDRYVEGRKSVAPMINGVPAASMNDISNNESTDDLPFIPRPPQLDVAAFKKYQPPRRINDKQPEQQKKQERPATPAVRTQSAKNRRILNEEPFALAPSSSEERDAPSPLGKSRPDPEYMDIGGGFDEVPSPYPVRRKERSPSPSSPQVSSPGTPYSPLQSEEESPTPKRKRPKQIPKKSSKQASSKTKNTRKRKRVESPSETESEVSDKEKSVLVVRRPARDTKRHKTLDDSEYEIEKSESEEEEEEYDPRSTRRSSKPYFLRTMRERNAPTAFWKSERVKRLPDWATPNKPIFYDERLVIKTKRADNPEGAIGLKKTQKKEVDPTAKMTVLERLVQTKHGKFKVVDPMNPQKVVSEEVARTKLMNTEKVILFGDENKTPDVLIQNGLTTPSYNIGKLILNPGATKPPGKPNRSYNTFYIVAGIVSIKLNGQEFHLSAGGHFLVPPNNTYTISNRSNRRPVDIIYVTSRNGPSDEENHEFLSDLDDDADNNDERNDITDQPEEMVE